MAGESPLGSLKLSRFPPESIRAETRMPTAPVGTAVLIETAGNTGFADASSVGGAVPTAKTLIVEVAAVELLSPSLTIQEMVRSSVAGFSEVLL